MKANDLRTNKAIREMQEEILSNTYKRIKQAEGELDGLEYGSINWNRVHAAMVKESGLLMRISAVLTGIYTEEDKLEEENEKAGQPSLFDDLPE